MDYSALMEQAPVAAAIVVVVGLFVRVIFAFVKHMKEEREDRADERGCFITTIENHVDHGTKAQEAQSVAIRDLNETIKVFSERVRNCPARTIQD